MNHSLKGLLAATTFASVAACIGTNAHAGCAALAASTRPHLQKQSGTDAARPRLVPVDWRHHDDDIVGMWNIVVTGKGNGNQFDGAIVDRGLQQWKDDGTEFLNSSTQNPMTQNYCMGVWEKTGPYTDKLNHFAYTYDGKVPDNAVNGVARIRQDVVLSRDGNEIRGTEITELFNADRNHLLTIRGVLVGKRVTLDTTAREIR